MINKFIKIQGVGKFANFNAKGDVIFVKNNIIYAENGYGKTTLTSILSSLKSNSPEQILKRKTIGIQEQKIEILANGKIYKYLNDQWLNKFNEFDIEIFDTFFVNDNIFSGFEFSASHRKNLYQFIFGKESIKLNNEIANIKNVIETQNKELKEIQDKIQKQITDFEFSTFLKLPKESEIENIIEQKQKEYEFAQKQKQITAMKGVGRLPINTERVDIDYLRQIIQSSVETISSEFVNLVENNINKVANNIPDAKEWIKTGTQYIQKTKSNSCPFCQQSLDDNQLIVAYQNFFSETYKAVSKQLTDFINRIKTIKASIENNQLNLTHTENKYSLELWNKYFNKELVLNQIQPQTELLTCIDSLIILIEKKRANLLLPLTAIEVELFEKSLNQHQKDLANYNSVVDTINLKIDELKERSKPSSEIERELRQLNLTKLRYNSEMVSLCNEYKKKWIALRDNNKEKAEKQKQLYEFSTKQINDYGEQINYYLKKFDSPFTIKKIRSAYSGTSKQASVNYEIQFKNQTLSFNENNNISAKYALSEGDKSTLAFSFFLAKLDLKKDLKNNAIIIDDPISSLDKNRRLKTINMISSLSQKVKQTIVLTHNKNFSFDLFSNDFFSPKPFLIDFSGNLIEYEDIKKDMEAPYFKWIQEVESYIENPTEHRKEYFQGQIRRIIEDTLKYRFFNVLYKTQYKADGTKIEPYSDKKGLGAMIEIIENSDIVFKNDRVDTIRQIKELNQFSNQSHHGNLDKAHRLEPVALPELLNNLKELLNIIFTKI